MKTPRSIHELSLPFAFWSFVIISVAAAGIVTVQAIRLSRPDWFVVLAFILIIMVVCLLIIASYRMRIDEDGVTRHVGSRRLHLPWADVRAVEVWTPVNGRKMISVSRVSPADHMPADPEEAKRAFQRTITFSYSPRRLDCIRQYWPGDVREG